MTSNKSKHNLLKGARVYLSGPMDFVANRIEEKERGWRVRVTEFLEHYGVTVFDPWNKPDVRGMYEYGREDVKTINQRDTWSFSDSRSGARARGELAHYFWETMHIDLRMVDISDFVIAYCPTNIYSVGTVHEIVLARTQKKPVLFVSPPVQFDALHELEAVARGDNKLLDIINKLRTELPIKENPRGIPSLWYMPLISSNSFFDGFGFSDPKYHRRFKGWKQETVLDTKEKANRPARPLMDFLETIARDKKVPTRWNHATQNYVEDDDWLLLEQSLKR